MMTTVEELISFIQQTFNRLYNIYRSVNSLKSNVGMKLFVALPLSYVKLN